METVSITHHAGRDRLMRLRDSVIDAEVAVDDARAAVNNAVDRLRVAVAQRDRIARELASLVDILQVAA